MQENQDKPQPLEGVRVLDCGIYHAGPGGLAILGDLGAEVIKIEQPGSGDPMRGLNRIGRIPFDLPGGGNLFYEGANRHKKSVTIDLSRPRGREILHRLVEKSDVFMTNMRKPAVRRMQLTYDRLGAHNPRLIYAAVSAFGPHGPDKDLGGFDYQGQARSGFMYSMGEEGMPPIVCQFGIIDQVTAIMTSHQILTALYMRERTGKGQEMEVSIFGSAVFLLYFNVLIAHMKKQPIVRHKRATENPMRNYYQCRDGKWLMMTLTPEERHWGPLCQAVGRPELEPDPRFATGDARLEHPAELVAILDEAFALRPLADWLEIFARHDLFCCAVNTVHDLAADPQALANDYVVPFEHPDIGPIKVPGYPVHFSDARAITTGVAPRMGEHTEQILTELADYTPEELAGFRKDAII